jgi:DNA-directed RNA polymerase I, II, and III subunit RPABC1
MSKVVLQISEHIYRSRVNLLDMLQDRGYNVDQYRDYTLNDITIMLNNQNKNKDTADVGPLDIIISKENTEKIYVKYWLTKFKKTSKLDKMIDEIFKTHLTTKDTLVIIVLDAILFKPSKENHPEIYVNEKFNKHKYFIQFFGLENLLFNVTKHKLVPKHTLLTESEVKKVLKDNNCQTKKSLPTIRREDPVAKYIGMRPNDVCKIEYPSIASGIYLKYRKCTPT